MKSVFRNLSDVHVFLAVLRDGSTLAASRTLGVAQPTVARRIEVLEHAPGLVLFERSTQGFCPTPDARALRPFAEAIEAAAKDFDAVAARQASAMSRTIRITAVTDAFNSRLSAILEGFVESYPEVRFDLIPSDETVDIAGGDADVAIRWTNADIDEPSLICRKLTTVSVSMFASKSYSAASSVPTSDAELQGHKFLTWAGRLEGIPANVWLRDRITSDMVAMTCRDFKAMETAIRMGTGLGILPTRFMRTDQTLVQCFELPEDLGSNVWHLINPTAYSRPEVKAFTTYFAPIYGKMLRET